MRLSADVLACISKLEPGKPARIVLNTNGSGEWKIEVTVFHGQCSGPEIELEPVLEQMRIAVLSIVS